jgi:drug/metabolite transporter (DMT)-like permease
MRNLKTYIAITFSMIFWSVSFIWTRVAIESFPPVTLVSLRLIIASVLLFAISILSGKFQKIRKEDLKWFVLLAFFEPFMYYIGETYGLTMVESTLASVIVSTIPLFAPIFAYFLVREKIGWMNITGILVSLMGVFLVIYEPVGGLTTNPFGVALLFLAVFSAICYTTTLRKIPAHYSTVNVILYQSLIGLGFFIPTFFVTDFSSIHSIHVSSQAIGALLMLAVFASVIAFVLFAGVVRKIGVAKTNVFVNLIPVFTAIFAWWFLDESLTWLKILGILIVVSGLFVSQLRNMKFKFKQIRGPQY